MKKAALFFCMMLVSAVAHAATQGVAQVTVSDNIAREQCAVKLGAQAKPFQMTVVDARPNPSVGSLKKGDTVSDVMLGEKVSSVFDKALRAALNNCGYKVVASAPTKVTVNITEFFADGSKSFLKAETKARAHIAVNVNVSGVKQNMDFSLDATDTGMRTGKLKQLQGTLETVMNGTIVQMVTSQGFVDGLK